MIEQEHNVRKQYHRPEMKVVMISNSDIIATSDPLGLGRNYYGDLDWEESN